ncbi:MAG: pyrimidine operon attenuation protein/uracil phosphoribosyltransferase [Gammaproteobacteria bacterium]|jgi:pyrimidine operon attenuation protein/uracil phosphoribosyltransferase
MSTNKHNIEQIIADMQNRLSTYLSESDIAEPLLIGIQTGGLWVADRLRQALNITSPLGELNIAFYRDDFSRIGIHPHVSPSSLPFDIEDRHIILIDDVLYTGRTIRAAMNEIFDYGRPASISLAVLIDRSGRELPIQANVVGKRVELKSHEHVKLLGPEPLALEFK